MVDDDRSILKLAKNVLELDAYDVTTCLTDRRARATNFVGYDFDFTRCDDGIVNGFEPAPTFVLIFVSHHLF